MPYIILTESPDEKVRPPRLPSGVTLYLFEPEPDELVDVGGARPVVFSTRGEELTFDFDSIESVADWVQKVIDTKVGFQATRKGLIPVIHLEVWRYEGRYAVDLVPSTLGEMTAAALLELVPDPVDTQTEDAPDVEVEPS